MRKKLLIVTWEYPGHSSRQGAALARRVGQVANDFVRNEWEVTVIQKDQASEVSKSDKYTIKKESTLLKRIVVQGEHITEYYWWEKLKFVRQITTILIAVIYGDRSYRWAKNVIRLLPVILNKRDYKPDLVISFFTPRAPMLIANYATRYYKTPWITDFQDSIDEGYKKHMQPIINVWTSRILRPAKAITHVSPEWAERDGKLLQRKIYCIRHAVPLIEEYKTEVKNNISEKEYKIFYAGSLDTNYMSLDLFGDVYNEVRKKGYPLKLQLAGNSYLLDVFKKVIADHDSIDYLGWLTPEQLYTSIKSSDVLLVIPWSSYPRQVIPSKFFEFAAFDKPIWVIGNDTGSFEKFFNEAGHSLLPVSDKEKQIEAIIKAIHNDISGLFAISNCSNGILKENELYGYYIKALNERS